MALNSSLEVTQGIRNYAETWTTNQSLLAPHSSHCWDLHWLSGEYGQLQLSHRRLMGQLEAELCSLAFFSGSLVAAFCAGMQTDSCAPK